MKSDNKEKTIKKFDSFEKMMEDWEANKTVWDKIEIFIRTPYWKFFDFKFKLKTKIARFKRGYAPIDTWNVNNWFIDHILKILKDFKANLHGYPAGLTEESWNKIIDDMIEGFKITQKVNNQDAIFKTDFNKANKRVKKVYEDQGTELVSKEKHNKAFKLFHKYFFNLWD